MLKNPGRWTTLASQSGHRSFQVRANVNGGGSGGAPSMSAVTTGKPVAVDIMDGLIDVRNDKLVRQICRDIYFFDPIGGSAVDLYAHVPFGEFTLTGIPESDIVQKFYKSCTECRIKGLMPIIATDHLVDGAFLGVLNYDDSDKIFNQILPQNLDIAEFQYVPGFGHTPVIDLKFPYQLKKLLTSKDERIKKIVGLLPKFFQEAILKGRLQLNNDNALYVPKRSVSWKEGGTSWFQRILPIYLLEKALLRGTIELAHRRQRGILHVIAGGEDWEPNNFELAEIAGMFQTADMDPIAATVATRPDIQVQEIQQGGEFWQIESTAEWAASTKFRALGISEQFLSGEVNYSSAEASMTLFMNQIRQFREEMTRAIFYEKFFPYIAIDNDFKKDKEFQAYGSFVHKASIEGNENVDVRKEIAKPNGKRIFKTKDGFIAVLASNDGLFDIGNYGKYDISEFHIPIVTWHTSLRPEADTDYLNRLQMMSQAGIPVPLRMIAAAVGIDLADILHGKDEDIKVREEIDKYKKSIEHMLPQPTEGQENPWAMESSFHPTEWLDGIIGKRPVAKREFDTDLLGPKNSHGPRHIVSARKRNEKNEQDNRIVAKVLANLAQAENYRTKGKYTINPKRKK